MLLFSMAVCAFIYIDAYFIPQEKVPVVITGMSYFKTGPRRIGGVSTYTYTLQTTRANYDIPYSLYNSVGKGDTIIISKSIITGAIQKAETHSNNDIYSFDIGFVRSGYGRINIPVLSFILILIFIVYRSINYLPGRRNITFALFICSLVALFFHVKP